MKRLLQISLAAAAVAVSLNACKSDAADTAEMTTTTTTTTTYSGIGTGGEGSSSAGSQASSGADVESDSRESATGRTVYINEGRSNTDARKKRTVIKTKYTPGNYPESSERLLTDKDVVHLSPWGKKVMMNEIYARHGMTFTDPVLKDYFSKQSWYDGRHKAVDSKLSAIERQNINLLSNMQ